MSRFLEDAVSIFETAASAPRDGASQDLAILLDDAGALRIVDATGWAPEALQSHYGARTVYQVAHTPEGVRVTGRCEGQRCTLAADRPAALLSTMPCYQVVAQRLLS